MARCGLFRGLPGAGAAGNHVITTDDSAFEALGINTFTTGELWQVLQGYTADDKSLAGVLETSDASAATHGTTADAVLYYSILNADGVNEEAKILRWDEPRKKYVTTVVARNAQPYAPALNVTPTSDANNKTWTIQKIIDTNNMLNNGQLDSISPLNVKAKKFLLDVKNSQSGCVTWSQVFKVRFTPDVMNSPASGACVDSNGNYAGSSETACSGSNTWNPDFYPADISPGCVKTNRVHFRLFLYDNRNPRDNARPIVGHGAPRMSMTPITAFGQEWSNERYDTGTKEPGVFPKPEPGGSDNPVNPAVGELDVHFNDTTGKFESGTKQILARLLTIVPSVPINALGGADDADWSAIVDSLNQDQIFQVDSETYMGAFAVGYAMPLMLHNGNPYHFGPAWQDKTCNGDKKSKIRVINRSSRTFAVGDVVMCSLINNEWIIQDFGQSGPQVPIFEIGKWEFSKLIVDRDSYFRDQRHWSKNNQWSHTSSWLAAGTPFKYEQHTSPDAFESIYRTKYYMRIAEEGPWNRVGIRESLPNILSTYNALEIMKAKNLGILANDFTYTLPPPENYDFQGSSRYWQTSSLDFMDIALGGTQGMSAAGGVGGIRGHVIGRTQINLKSNGDVDDQDPQYAQVYAPFWGPVFDNGYTPASVKNSRAIQNYGFRRAGGYTAYVAAKYYMFEANWNDTIFNTSVGMNRNFYGPIFGGVLGSTPDLNVKQMPADIACLAAPQISDDVGGKNGSPMVISRYIAAYSILHSSPEHSRERINKALWVDTDNANPYRRGPRRWMWLNTEYGPNMNNANKVYDSFYDWKPAGDKTLTFIPVTSDYICSWDETTQHIPSHTPDSFWNSSRSQLNNYQNKVDDLIPQGFWKRNENLGIGLRASKHLKMNSHSPSMPYLDPIVPPLDHQGTRSRQAIPYGGYVMNPGKYLNYSLKHWNFDTNLGGTHGVTTARVSVRIKNADMTFKTSYRLGMCNLIVNHTGGQMFFRKWGRGNEIHSKESTALHALVCGAWPRSLTIFDSRYFAVHHFNPGQSYTVFDGTLLALETELLHEVPDPNQASYPYYFGGAQSWQPGQTLPDFPRLADTTPYSVDFKIPSWFVSKEPPKNWNESTASNSLEGMLQHETIPMSTLINGAMVKGTDKKPLDYPLVAPTNEWNVDRIRRQMLLPFSYMKRTIGIHPNSWVIEDGGRDYKPGDILTCTGGTGTGAAIKVLTTDNAQGAPFGAIKTFNMHTLGPQEGAGGGTKSLGEGYQPQDFINPQIVDHNNYIIDKPQIYVDAASGLGNGASIFAKYGYTTWYWKTDKGPVRNSMQRLTPNSGGSTDEHCGGLYDQEFTTTTMSMDEQSEDGRYDVFLHFHNDISHNSSKDRGGVGEGFENHVSLTINAT